MRQKRTRYVRRFCLQILNVCNVLLFVYSIGIVGVLMVYLQTVHNLLCTNQYLSF